MTQTIEMTGSYIAVSPAGEVIITNRSYNDDIDYAILASAPADSTLGHILHGQKTDGDSSVGLNIAAGKTLYAKGRAGTVLVATLE